jgi:predicted nucleotide-binding protein
VSDRVDARIVTRLQKKLGISRSQTNRQIAARARSAYLTRRQAAIALAAENGVSLTNLAQPEDWAALRGAGARTVAAPAAVAPADPPPRPGRLGRSRPRRARKEPGNSVFVIHGRNERIRRELFSLLRNLGVNPIEWNKAIELTRTASPYIGQVIEAGFRKAVAVVALLTPDDEGYLKAEFRKAGDPAYERKPTGQPRLNVVFEAGRAFGTHPKATVLVQVGRVRPFSDISGMHVVNLSNSAASRQELATKLENAGCEVDRSGTAYLVENDFTL